MAQLSRRRLLGASGLAVAGSLLASCDTAPRVGGGNAAPAPGSTATLRWWDHFNPLQDLHKQVFAEFEKDAGVTVEYTAQQTAKMGQALQLAKQSHQLPDVHSNVGLNLPLAALIKDNWYQPLDLDDDALGRLPDGSLVEGITTFDGKVYSFPIFNFRQYWAATWFNKDLVSKAGLDPASPPETYDDFRTSARKVRTAGGDGIYGWMLALGQPDRIAEQIGFLAQAGGFEGAGGQLFRTGEFAYHHEAYVHAVEFWLAMEKDGLLVPGTQSFNDKIARARWATGMAGFYFDGPWCAGVVAQDLKQFADKLDVGPMLVPEQGMPVTAYRGPTGGAFWLSGESKQRANASKLLGRLTTPDYYVGLAENMDQPPLDLAAVEKAEVHPAYKKVVGMFQDSVFLAPVPVVKNPDVARVNAESKEVLPGLGETVQGLFSGDLGNVRAALKDLSDRSERDREAATAAAKRKGAKVQPEDWAFPDWKAREDYTADRY